MLALEVKKKKNLLYQFTPRLHYIYHTCHLSSKCMTYVQEVGELTVFIEVSHGIHQLHIMS